MKTKGFILPLVAVACLGYAVVSIAQTQPKRELTEPPSMPPRSTFENTVAAVGLVEPSSEGITVGSHLSGVVDAVHVKAGDPVKKGAPLFTLDTRALEARKRVAAAQLARAEAEIGLARASLDQAIRKLELANGLSDPRAISAEERDDRASEVAKLEASLASANAGVTLAKAELASAETDLELATVQSPIDATVLQVRLRPGESIQAGGSAEGRIQLGRTSPLHIRADIDEFEIPRLKPGTRATASPRGNASERIELEFVRFEPLVVPKQSLTGDSTERVDTRVLQAIYRIVPADASVFTGQQMDIFIEADPRNSES